MRGNATRVGLLFMIALGLFLFSRADTAAELNFTGVMCPDPMHTESLYSPHDPIIITSNQDFIDQAWTGNGSKTNPFLIQGLSIINDERCISISSTDVYFKISDCFLSYENSQNQGIGIALEEARYGTIVNCEINGLYYGLYLNYADNNTIMFNDIDSNMWGINLYVSKGCEVFNNTISDIRNVGINADEAVDCFFANNSFSSEFYGMMLDESVNCTLLSNKFENLGLWIRGSEKSHFLSHIFDSNIVGAKPISVLMNRSSEMIDASSYGQLFLFNSSDCVVENGVFDYRSVGVSLALCNGCTVRNLKAAYAAICLVELQICSNIHVTECNISESYNSGFRFSGVENCSLTDCKTGNSPGNTVFGIELYNTENTTIASNVFSANGILTRNNIDCLIMHNTIEGSPAVQGIGVHASNSYNCTIIDNELFELYIGVLSETGNSNFTILNNRIHDNRQYGIEIRETCEGFRIYNNSFWYNDVSHAIDNGASNYWDDGISIGNQWDDYNGTGVYNIPGSAGSIDHFPRADPLHTRTTTIITTTTTTTTGETAAIDPILFLLIGLGTICAVIVVSIIFIKQR